MNLVDSSGWLEYFSDSPNADFFSKALKDKHDLIVPSISLYEVFKVVLRERNEDDALQTIAVMQQCQVIDLTSQISIQSAINSIKYKLPMADSIIYTTAQLYNAVLWTQDIDFKNIPNVKYITKKN